MPLVIERSVPLSLTLPNSTVDYIWQESHEGTGFSGGFGIPEFNNVSVASNGTSRGNGDWGFSFDFKPSPVTQDNFFFETYSKSKPTSDANVSDSSRVDDDVWGFKDAISETGSEHKLVS